MANTILLTDATKLGFDFKTTPGSVIISYPGVASITVSGWRQWFTYTSGGKLYFQDESATGGVNPPALAIFNSDKVLTVSLSPGSGGAVNFIGNGDLRPSGSILISPNIANTGSGDPALYVNVDIVNGTFTVTYSS